MLWFVIRLIFKTSSVTPDFFYVFNLILSFSTCSQSFNKICAWEVLGANVLNIWPWRGIFLSVFRWQLVPPSCSGSIQKHAFPHFVEDLKSGIGVGFIALEWPGKGQEQYCSWPSIWQTKFPRSTFHLFFYLFQNLYT